MNIAVCINTLSAGGAETFAVSLAIEYKKKGNNVIVVVHNILDEKGVALQQELASENITLYNANAHNFFSKLLLPFKYARVFRMNEIHFIHSNLEQTDTYTLLSKFFYRSPKLIRTLHNKLPFSYYPYWIHKVFFKCFKFNVGCGEDMVNEYSYVDLRKCLIPINNGVKIDQRTIEDKKVVRNSIRKELGLNDSDILFVQIGTMSPRFGGVLTKGHDITFEAINKLQAANVRFLIVGNSSEKNNPQYYRQELVNDPRIIYTGVVDNVSDYILASDVILAPSRTEGLPISTMEAVIEGKPLICSSIKQFNCFHGPMTLTFELDNIDSLVQNIETIVNNYLDFSLAAQKKQTEYIRQFSIAETARKYLELLHTL